MIGKRPAVPEARHERAAALKGRRRVGQEKSMSNNTITSETGSAADPSRSEPNVLDNVRAMTILKNAVSELRAIGVPCMLAPMALPQGMTISLHAGTSVESAVAAYAAGEAGGEYAGAAATHAQFMSKVEQSFADTEAVDLVRNVR